MLPKKYIAALFFSLCAFFPYKLIAQADAALPDSAAFLNKINSLQLANYKPQKARNGKDGDARFTPIFFKSGRHGNDGKSGKNGPDLHVKISQAILYGQAVVKVAVHSADNAVNDIYYVNPLKGQLKIIADGGDGGDGGHGENESDSNSSAGGGDGGNGGNGGNVEISVEQADKGVSAYGWIIISNAGGLGGRGGSGGKSKDSRYEASGGGKTGTYGNMGTQVFNK